MSGVIPVTVIEFDPFAAAARRAGMSEKEREELTDFLARNPEAGAVIVGTGGLRKLRWRRPGTGKSGGYRAIYYFLDRDVPICLLTIYTKAEKDELTGAEKRILSGLGAEIKSTLRGMRRAK